MRSPESLPLGGKVPSECEADEGAGCHPLCRAAISRPLRKLPSSLRRGAMRPPVEVSAPCRAREGGLPCKGKRDRPEPRLSAPRTSAGRPVSGPYEKGGTASVYAVGAAHRAARPAFPLPGGRCPSAHTGADEGEPVGRGLKVNRPKAERSHPGVCPRPAVSVNSVPAPLRQNRDKSVSQSRRSGAFSQEPGYFITFSLRQQDRSLSIAGLFFPSLSFCGPTARLLFVCFFRPVCSFCGEKRPLSLHTPLCQQYIVSLFFYTSIY